MEINYELSQIDYRHLMRRSSMNLFVKIIGTLVLIVGLVLFVIYLHDGVIIALVSALAGMTTYVLAVIFFLRYIVRVSYRMRRRFGSLGKTTVRLEPDSLISTTHLVKSDIRWEAVTRIAEDAQGFYLNVNQFVVIMVPRHAFASNEEAQVFWALATEYYQHAKPATVGAERVRLGR